MQALSQFLIKSKQNKLFVIVVIGICMGVIEFTTHFFSNIPAKMSGGLANQVVAVVQTVQTDVRQKPVEEQGWYRAEPLTEVMRGDAIYSGRQSRSQVKMKSGGILELGEETLVIFDDVDGVTIPDVSRGQVKLKVSGQMKIAISGEVTEFTGAQSELLLNADGTTRNIRVVKGQTSVTRKGVVAKSLTTGETLDLPASQAAPPKIAIPKADDLISTVKISEKRNVVESKKPVKPVEFAPAPIEKPVETPPAPASVTSAMDAPPAVAPLMEGPEIATAPSLPVVPPAPVAETAPVMPEPITAKEALAVQEPEVKIDRVMKVQEVYERKGDRALVPRSGMKYLKVPVALSWQGATPEDKVFVQVAKDKSFAKPWVEKETAGHNVVIDSWKPGRNFWRVSRDKQAWSEPGEVVVKPTVAIAQSPSVTAFKSQVFVYPKGKGPEAEAKLRFQDSGLSKPRGWVLQGSNTSEFNPAKTKTVYMKEPRVDIPLKREGKYFFRVRSVAAAGEISSFSSPIVVKAVKSSAAPVEIAPRLTKQEKKSRELAAIDEQKDFKQDEFKSQDYTQENLAPRQEATKTTSKLETVEATPRDLRPRPWSVTVEGGETALVSSDQLSGSAAPASTHIAALRLRHNDGRNSGSIAYRTKWGGANAEGNAQSNTRIELRYTRWWQTRWTPIRLGWIGGFDSYRNPTATNYSKGYDAAKTGLDVAIRLSDRWKTGGDILIGTWTDSNRVYEFGGFLSYDLTDALAFGVGYRLSLFDAATLESAPLALPYREAMGEAYSSLQFSF